MNKELTPFEKAGYTKDTKFRVVTDIYGGTSKGNVVWLARDDGTNCPIFTNGISNSCFWLPCADEGGVELEVIEDTVEPITTKEEEESYPHIQVKLSAVDKTPTYRVHFNELYHRDLSKAEAEEVYSLLGIVLNKN